MTTLIAIILAIVTSIFASVTAPLILAHRTEKMHREDMQTDYARQDKVALEAARASAAAQGSAQMAQQAAEGTAAKLDDTNSKLDVIHGLVNSDYSAAMQSQLDALITSAAMMREVMDLKRSAGHEPTAEADIALQNTEAKIAELRVAIADRLKQAEVIADRAETAAVAAKAAAQAAEAKAVPYGD
jgi:hypothetical protein